MDARRFNDLDAIFTTVFLFDLMIYLIKVVMRKKYIRKKSMCRKRISITYEGYI